MTWTPPDEVVEKVAPEVVKLLEDERQGPYRSVNITRAVLQKCMPEVLEALEKDHEALRSSAGPEEIMNAQRDGAALLSKYGWRGC